MNDLFCLFILHIFYCMFQTHIAKQNGGTMKSSGNSSSSNCLCVCVFTQKQGFKTCGLSMSWRISEMTDIGMAYGIQLHLSSVTHIFLICA